MTREEIKNTPELVDLMLDKCILADSRTKVIKRLKEVCDLAIKALEQEPCDDVVSRQAVLDQTYLWSKDEFLRVTNPFDYLRKRINSLPSVAPQSKIGYWIIKDGKEQGYDIGGVKTWYIQIMCDKCGFIKTAIEGHTGQYHYCPNCGARIEGERMNETDN